MYKELVSRLEAQANPQQGEQMSAYMRNQFSFFGIQASQRKELTKDFIKSDKALGQINWALLNQCWDHPHRELQYFVIDYLKSFQKQLNFYHVHDIWPFIKTKQWWDTIDGLDRIVGNIAFVDERINGLMVKWSTDEDFWVRRIAINHQRHRKDKTNTQLLEEILVNNLESEEFFINKAIGWSLRDYSKTNPQWVEEFIDKYGAALDALSIREASKYI